MTEEITLSKHVLLAIALAPLLGSIIAGLFGRQVGRMGAQLATILGVAVSCALSCWVLYQVVGQGASPFNQNVYTFFEIGGYSAHVGFMVDRLTAMMMVVVTFVSLLVLIGIKAKSAVPYAANAASEAADTSNTRWLAQRLFSEFILPFEFAAVILTVAVIAAVTLTLRRRVGTKHQNPAEQSRVKAADRLRMVKVAAQVPSADPPSPAAPSDQEVRP